MTAALRSPDRLGKPRRPRSVWAAVRVFVVPPVVALTLLLAVRGLAVTQVSLPADRPELGLLAGDRVLVDRTAFGLCLPLPGCEAPLRAAAASRGAESWWPTRLPARPKGCAWAV